MSKPKHIISTAYLPDHLITKMKEHHIIAEVIPFIQVTSAISNANVERIKELARSEAFVVFTSANSVKAIAGILQANTQWKIYCLMGATLRAVTEHFDVGSVVGTATDSLELVEVIKSAGINSLVFFCGNLRHDAIPKELPPQGIAVEEIVVYRTELTPHKVSFEYDGILFFSPSGVESFFCLNTVKPSQVVFAMGNTTAACARKKTVNAIHLPPEPGKDSIVDLVIQYYHEHD